MASVNKVILIGNLGKDPEIRTTPQGTTLARFSLATTTAWKDASGAKQERTEWHTVAIFSEGLIGVAVRAGRGETEAEIEVFGDGPLFVETADLLQRIAAEHRRRKGKQQPAAAHAPLPGRNRFRSRCVFEQADARTDTGELRVGLEHRGALPHQRPERGARGGARRAGHPLPRAGRGALLPAS